MKTGLRTCSISVPRMTTDGIDTEVMDLRHFVLATCEKDASGRLTRRRQNQRSEQRRTSKDNGNESANTRDVHGRRARPLN